MAPGITVAPVAVGGIRRVMRSIAQAKHKAHYTRVLRSAFGCGRDVPGGVERHVQGGEEMGCGRHV